MAEKIVSIALGAISVALVFAGYYFYVRAKIAGAAAGAIESAEETGKSGAEKLDGAVALVMTLVPVALKPFIRENFVRKTVQAAFDKIEAYAKKQAGKGDGA